MNEEFNVRLIQRIRREQEGAKMVPRISLRDILLGLLGVVLLVALVAS